jgi:hypothetical protein
MMALFFCVDNSWMVAGRTGSQQAIVIGKGQTVSRACHPRDNADAASGNVRPITLACSRGAYTLPEFADTDPVSGLGECAIASDGEGAATTKAAITADPQAVDGSRGRFDNADCVE